MENSTFSDEKKYLLATDIALNTLGYRRFKKIAESGLSFRDLWSFSSDKIRARLGGEKFVDSFLKNREFINPDAKLEKLKNIDIDYITILDPEYPKLLREIFSPPAVLYYKGDIGILEEHTLAVVGSRKFTNYGRSAIEKIVSSLAEAGYVIASGMALGIDTFAHESTLKSGGKTVAVLGCGLNKPYPATNTNLFERIIGSGGLVLSEYMPGKPPLRQHFPARNRIISGISNGILIVEAGIRSGALITARDALEQNRDVFAIPGPIFGESSSGTNQLLKMGANPVTDVEDIFNFYGHKSEKIRVKSKPSNPTEEAIFEALTESESHVDQIIKSSGLEAQVIISTLTLMEIKGKVKNLGGMVYTLN